MKLYSIIALAGALAVTVIGGSAFAKTSHKPAPKLIEVRTCPGTGEKVVGNGSGSEVVGKYKVYFCCAMCQPDFDKLTKAQKLAKLATLAKAK